QADLDLAVHHQRELVLARRAPAGGALHADGLDHVLDVLTDGHLLEWPGLRGDLEDVPEDVVASIVVDDLDAALRVVLERPEACGVFHRASPFRPSPSSPRPSCRHRRPSSLSSLRLSVSISRTSPATWRGKMASISRRPAAVNETMTNRRSSRRRSCSTS